LHLRVTPTADTSSYPPPYNDLVSTPRSPEAVCEQWFSYRHEFPADKKDFFEKRYQECITALKTDFPAETPKAIPTPEFSDIHLYPFFQRTAGIGIISETDFSTLPSTNKIINSWSGEVDGKKIIVYAGALRIDPTTGKSLGRGDWMGVLVIRAPQSDNQIMPGDTGQYFTPDKSGILRIVNAEDTVLVLSADNGASYTFDVSSRQYLSTKLDSLYQRPVSWGKIIECIIR
jgi:hypothetical protein